METENISCLTAKETAFFIFNYGIGFGLLYKGKLIHRRLRTEFVMS